MESMWSSTEKFLLVIGGHAKLTQKWRNHGAHSQAEPGRHPVFSGNM